MQTNWNLDDLIADVAATVENHKTAQPGAYARYLWDNAQHTRKLGSNEYGCADAANIRYIIEQPERDPATRAACTAPRTARRRGNCVTRCRGSRWRFANPTARWTGCMRCWTA